MKRVVMLSIGLALALGWAGPAAAADEAAEFPVGYEGYHTYAEMNAELDAAVATYGQGPNAILKRYLIGHSYEGREIVAIKVSDNVATDESEPEVLSVSMVHAREHITLEMNLYLIRLLTEKYGQSDALGRRVTDIVNGREIWVIPMANPDGTIYNISDGVFHGWRKKRQLNPGLGHDRDRP